MKKLIGIILLFTFANVACAYENNQLLPEPKLLVVDKSITATQAEKMILAAKLYANFWHTGDENFAKQALATDFIDLNLPQGRKQGVQGPLDASKWFRGVVPDLTVSIEQMLVIKDKVILQLKFQGHFTGKFHDIIGKGQKIEFSAVDIYSLKNGKIATNWHLEDNQALMQQLSASVNAASAN